MFINGSLANNKDLSSQLDYKIIFINESYDDDNSFIIRGNFIY